MYPRDSRLVKEELVSAINSALSDVESYHKKNPKNFWQGQFFFTVIFNN